MSKSSEKEAQFPWRIGWWICLTATLAGTGLQAVYFTHAGALWRDEAGGVQLAVLPSFGETWRMLAHDGFPVFFPALVRVWSALGLGASDMALRTLGLFIGLGILAAMWLNGRLMGFRMPFISLGLLAANVAVVTWGDSLRAYGCGSLFILITLGLIWRLMRAPGRLSFLLATLAAVLSVQTLFQNAFLLLAACVAGSVVCARHRQWRTAGWVMGVGLVAGMSLAPYAPHIMESQSWWILQKTEFDPARIGYNVLLALGSLVNWPFGVWLGLMLLTAVAGGIALLKQAKDTRIGPEDLSSFGAAALAAGIAGFLAFIRLSELPTEPWYFLPFMVFAATAMDAALAQGCHRFHIWSACWLAAMVGLQFPTTWKFAEYRQTNIDLIAAELQQQARPGDFIVVYPCHCGITFERYYTGRIPWTTSPAIADLRFHRFDLLKEKMQETFPVKPELDQMAQTLASNHTLWLVFESPDKAPPQTRPSDLPPAPLPNLRWGWWEGFYIYAWRQQLEYWVATHARQVKDVSVKPDIRVNPYEKLSLIQASGWQEPAGTSRDNSTPP